MSTSIVTVKKVHKTFNNHKIVALKEVSFSLEEGKILAIVGESGSGKTTLIRLIAGLDVVDQGTIEVLMNALLKLIYLKI